MRRLMILVALALGLAGGAEAGPKPPKPISTAKPAITKTQPPKGGAAKGATVKGSASKGSTVKAKSAQPKGSTVKAKGAQAKASSGTSAKPAKGDTKLAKADAKAPKAEAKSVSSTTRTSTETIDFTATALGQKLQKNSALRSKIDAKLQAAGYGGTVYEAAYGFKNLGQLNAATNQVQNQGYSFDLLKVLMTATYVDPQTHVVYRANQLPDGTVKIVSAELATNPASTQSLGQAKQAIAAGAEMPKVELVQTTGTSSTGATSASGASPVSGTFSTSSTTTASKGKGQWKSKKKNTVSTTQPGANF